MYFWVCEPMIPGFEKIVEQRIQQARREGAFDNLPGKGKPLQLIDERHVPEDLRLAYKILKNADYLPVEIELRKEIQQTEDLLAGAEDVADQFRLTRKLNMLITRVNLHRNGRIDFEVPQRYCGKLASCIDAGQKKHCPPGNF